MQPPLRVFLFTIGVCLLSACSPEIGHGTAGSGVPAEVDAAITRLRAQADPSEAMDEALSGHTQRGTPIHSRTPDYFPAEPRDLFWEMDQVVDPRTGELAPLDFDANGDGKVDDRERDAIRGRNTWLLWGGGNEAFWGWLQERGYGLVDFLILLDSRRRSERFKTAGVINQPGFESVTARSDTILGLYIDRAMADDSGVLRPPDKDQHGAETVDARGRKVDPPVGIPPLPHGPIEPPFELGDPALYKAVFDRMPRDGLDYSVYGFPSGVMGLRLLLNPDFFGNTDDAKRAREYWDQRVTRATHSSYYTDPAVHKDPDLVRPFRVSMSCGFCHIGPHPLDPPTDPAEPKWRNLSSIIGGQYWKPSAAFANVVERTNFLHHFLNSQPPGTIDTSLVSTDHINNTNHINAVFDLPARLERALTKPAEMQAGANLLFLGKQPSDTAVPLQCPMVLFPGEDSCGVDPALARVPLNIGVFSEQWARSDNPLIGFTKQRPFPVATCRTNSVYWMVNERYRVPYMAAFFTLGNQHVAKSTAPMLLVDAGPERDGQDKVKHGPDGQTLTAGRAFLDSPETVAKGREVFLDNCAICHSSRQPAGFDLRFQPQMEGGWRASPAPASGSPAIYTLPSTYANWEAFRASPALGDYRRRIRMEVAGERGTAARDPFLENNFLSNELRIPITLVGTNAGRSLATNGMRGNVWDNYSSETFKRLPSVGKIRYFNPFAPVPADRFDGTNDEFDDGRTSGGPGYMRPPSLISVWATAPFFHNNALGLYNANPSVAGRVEAFQDGIHRLLYNSRRSLPFRSQNYLADTQSGDCTPPGDLRFQSSPAAASDPGYVYRLPVDTYFDFRAGYIPQLIIGVVGKGVFALISTWIWVLAVLAALLVAWKGRPRHAGMLVLAGGAVFAALLAVTGLGGAGGSVGGAMTMVAADWMASSSVLLWLLPVLAVALGTWLCLTRSLLRRPIAITFSVLALVLALTGTIAHKFLNGHLRSGNWLVAVLPDAWIDGEYIGVHFGPIPRGTPVDLLMNMDPDKRYEVVQAVAALARASLHIKREHLVGEEAYRVIADEAGPALLRASKCPDFVLDRGHWFGEGLQPEQKENLIAYLKTM